MPHLLEPSHVVKNKVCRGGSGWFDYTEPSLTTASQARLRLFACSGKAAFKMHDGVPKALKSGYN